MLFSNKFAKFDSRRVSEQSRSFRIKHQRLPYPEEWDTIMSGSRSGIEGHAVMNYFAPRGQTHLGQPSVRRALEWRAMHMHNLHAPGED